MSAQVPSHPADGPAEADRCTFCAHPRAECERWTKAEPLVPCCVNCSHANDQGGAS